MRIRDEKSRQHFCLYKGICIQYANLKSGRATLYGKKTKLTDGSIVPSISKSVMSKKSVKNSK